MSASEWFLVVPCIVGIALLLWWFRDEIRDFYAILKLINEPVIVMPRRCNYKDCDRCEKVKYIDLPPWVMLDHPVTEDGEGYYLGSPAGALVRITNEQRQFIVDAVKFYQQHKENA